MAMQSYILRAEALKLENLHLIPVSTTDQLVLLANTEVLCAPVSSSIKWG